MDKAILTETQELNSLKNSRLISVGSNTQLVLQTDGNLVLYQNRRAIWSTNTHSSRQKSPGNNDFTLKIENEQNNKFLRLRDNSNKNVLFQVNVQNAQNINTLLILLEDRLVLSTLDGRILWTSTSTVTTSTQIQTHLEFFSKQSESKLNIDNFKDENILKEGQILETRRLNNFKRISSDRTTELVLQKDGNLVLYFNNNPIWATDTSKSRLKAMNNEWFELRIETEQNNTVKFLRLRDFVNKNILFQIQISNAINAALVVLNGSVALINQNGDVLWTSKEDVPIKNETLNMKFLHNDNQNVWCSTTQSGGRDCKIYGLKNNYNRSMLTLNSLGVDRLVSPSGGTIMNIEQNGNIVLTKDGRKIWESNHSRKNTSGKNEINFFQNGKEIYLQIPGIWSLGPMITDELLMLVVMEGKMAVFDTSGKLYWTTDPGINYNEIIPFIEQNERRSEINTILDPINTRVNSLNQSFNNVNTTISNLNTKVNSLDQTLKQQITQFSNNVQTKILDLGNHISNRESNAGTISYQRFSNGLDIVGAGNSANNRNVSVYDNLSVNGNIRANRVDINSDLYLPMSITATQKQIDLVPNVILHNSIRFLNGWELRGNGQNLEFYKDGQLAGRLGK